jgi:hypothetical protein
MVGDRDMESRLWLMNDSTHGLSAVLLCGDFPSGFMDIKPTAIIQSKPNQTIAKMVMHAMIDG